MGLGFRRWGDMKGKGSGGSGSRLNGNVDGEKKRGASMKAFAEAMLSRGGMIVDGGTKMMVI